MGKKNAHLFGKLGGAQLNFNAAGLRFIRFRFSNTILLFEPHPQYKPSKLHLVGFRPSDGVHVVGLCIWGEEINFWGGVYKL